MPDTIERGAFLGDWALLVDGDVVFAVRQIPHNGQVYYSTEDRPTRADKTSTYGLDAREVVRRYVRGSNTDRSFGEFVDDVQVALGRVKA